MYQDLYEVDAFKKLEETFEGVKHFHVLNKGKINKNFHMSGYQQIYVVRVICT